MRRNKQAISLITLVITIIVMIIIAGAIILSLADTNVFEKAQNAVNKYNENQQQILDTLDWLDWEPGTPVVPKEWKDYVSGITKDGVPIPKGFVKSPYKGEGTKAEGLVIYALTEEEIKDGVRDITKIDKNHQESLEKRNQFVWVPVDDFKNEFKLNAFGTFQTAVTNKVGPYTDNTNMRYWEISVDSDNMPKDASANPEDYVSTATLEEANELYASVREYGGFYIARYEMGADGYNDEYYGRGNLSITMNKYPYNVVRWGNTMADENLEGGAVTVSRSLYPKSNEQYGVVSTLTYGVEWDRTLNWWKESYESKQISFDLLNSVPYGIYLESVIDKNDLNEGAKYSKFVYDSNLNTNFFTQWEDANGKKKEEMYLYTTGAYTKARVNNIYDMAGNLTELTMEGTMSWDVYEEGTIKTWRVYRGGAFSSSGNGYGMFCAPTRGIVYIPSADKNMGFRPALYIKYNR